MRKSSEEANKSTGGRCGRGRIRSKLKLKSYQGEGFQKGSRSELGDTSLPLITIFVVSRVPLARNEISRDLARATPHQLHTSFLYPSIISVFILAWFFSQLFSTFHVSIRTIFFSLHHRHFLSHQNGPRVITTGYQNYVQFSHACHNRQTRNFITKNIQGFLMAWIFFKSPSRFIIGCKRL